MYNFENIGNIKIFNSIYKDFRVLYHIYLIPIPLQSVEKQFRNR